MLADKIGAAEPALEISVEVGFGTDAEFVEIAAWSDFLDAFDAGMIVASREPQSEREAGLLHGYAGKAHAHLEYKPRFLRDDVHGAALANHAFEFFVELKYVWLAPRKQIFNWKAPAGMPDIARDEALAAIWAAPQWFGSSGHSAFLSLNSIVVKQI